MYDQFHFQYAKPADETIFSLAMAVFNCSCTVSTSEYLAFWPIVKKYDVDMLQGKAVCSTIYHDMKPVTFIHWATVNTYRAKYKVEAEKLCIMTEGKEKAKEFKIAFRKRIKWFFMMSYDYIKYDIVMAFLRYVRNEIRGIIKRNT